MPIVSFRSDEISLTNPYSTASAMYAALVKLLPSQGFTNVTNGGDHVHCDSGGISLSVTLLAVSGTTFWRVIMAAEDSNPANADTQIERVKALIDILRQ